MIPTHPRSCLSTQSLNTKILNTQCPVPGIQHLTHSTMAFSGGETYLYTPDRDYVGYGLEQPRDCWPNGAKIAVSFVLNCEWCASAPVAVFVSVSGSVSVSVTGLG